MPFKITRSISAVFLLLNILCLSAFSFSFAVVGDNRDGETTFRSILNSIKKDRSIKFAVNTGDLTSLGTKWEYNKYKSMTDSSGIVFYNVVGNHDIKNNGISTFNSMFGNRYISWESNGTVFITLDNVSQRGLDAGQLSWLKSIMAHQKSKTKIVFMHKPLFDVTGSFPDEVMYPKRLGRELTAMFEKNKVLAVFWGHIHGFGQETKNNILYVLAGGGGAPLYLPQFSGGFHHFVKVNVKGNKISIDTIKVNE